MPPPHALPIHPYFLSADAYVESLLTFYHDPLFQTLCGGIHILDFFIKDRDFEPSTLYNSLIPEEWRLYLTPLDMRDILDLLLTTPLDSLPEAAPESLRSFVTKLRVHSLRRDYVAPYATKNVPPRKRANAGLTWALNAGMKPKKIHEVENFSAYVDSLTKELNVSSDTPISHVVDYGAGQNYLGRILAKKYGHHVVGLESRSVNITGAQKLDAHFENLAQRREWKLANGTIQYIETHISSGSLTPLLPSIQPAEKEKNLLLISLHSCGNLLHHALKAFASTPTVKAVALIGCCYNLLTEKSGKTYKIPPTRTSFPALVEASSACDPTGFPVSRRFEDEDIILNITARSMAVQAPTNWALGGTAGFFVRHFWRALLQRILYDRGVITDASDPVILGSLRKGAYESFYAYVSAASEKMGWGEKMAMSQEQAEAYEAQFKARHKDLCVLWSLMAVAAGVVESLIVVDRYLFLREIEGVEAWVEQVFEYAQSPRNLVVVGVRR